MPQKTQEQEVEHAVVECVNVLRSHLNRYRIRRAPKDTARSRACVVLYRGRRLPQKSEQGERYWILSSFTERKRLGVTICA